MRVDSRMGFGERSSDHPPFYKLGGLDSAVNSPCAFRGCFFCILRTPAVGAQNTFPTYAIFNFFVATKGFVFRPPLGALPWLSTFLCLKSSCGSEECCKRILVHFERKITHLATTIVTVFYDS